MLSVSRAHRSFVFCYLGKPWISCAGRSRFLVEKRGFSEGESVQCEDVIFANSNSPRLLRDVLNREALRCFTLVNRAGVKHGLIPRPGTRHRPPSRQRQGVAWGCLWFPTVSAGVLSLMCASVVNWKGSRSLLLRGAVALPTGASRRKRLCRKLCGVVKSRFLPRVFQLIAWMWPSTHRNLVFCAFGVKQLILGVRN